RCGLIGYDFNAKRHCGENQHRKCDENRCNAIGVELFCHEIVPCIFSRFTMRKGSSIAPTGQMSSQRVQYVHKLGYRSAALLFCWPKAWVGHTAIQSAQPMQSSRLIWGSHVVLSA